MGRLVVTIALLAAVAVAAPRTAQAQATRKVTVETDPPGATVYLNDKESGPACTPTPCEVTAPVGETPMIIELDGYSPVLDSLVVPRGGKAPKVKFTLEATGGTLDVQWDGPADAIIKVDDKPKGKAPEKIALDAGPHRVVVRSNNKTIYDDQVTIELGDTQTIHPTVAQDAPPDPPVTDKPENPVDTTPTEVEQKTEPAGPQKPPVVIVSAIFDVGFRQFSYQNGKSNFMNVFNVGNDNEGGQLMAGPLVQVFPTRALGVDALKGLSIVGRLEFGFHDQTVQDAAIMDSPPTTFWQAIEVTARNEWLISDDSISLSVLAGYTRDRFEFSGSTDDIALVPDADYQSLEIGGRAALPHGTYEPYVEAANRIVLSGGELQTRFTTASANGIHAAAGVAIRSGNIAARIEGQITRYGWSFSNNGMQNPPYVADGGTDLIEMISIVIGYAY
jgi:hypothetical protein|nr:PEGA domain-containing protein [Kofleriaceae bacterium]